MQRQYIAIDLKSFYASVECRERNLDPLTTNLVVADMTRTEKTIGLAVSPSLKSFGVPGRPRMFEVVQKIREANNARKWKAPGKKLVGESYFYNELMADPSLEITYLVAPPRMALYMEYSTRIYDVYLKYVAPEDIFAYSIDEVFIDATYYLNTYKMSAHELAMTMIRDVLATTGITATAGIGSNMYLAKIAMDIKAKKMQADKDGVRIAELDEITYRKELWEHKPLTAFWRVGSGYASKKIMEAVTALYDRIVDVHLLVRRVTIAACKLERADAVKQQEGLVGEQLTLFMDLDNLEQTEEEMKKADEREKAAQKMIIEIHKKFGKNAIMKGMNLEEGATSMERNRQIGGHRA